MAGLDASPSASRAVAIAPAEAAAPAAEPAAAPSLGRRLLLVIALAAYFIIGYRVVAALTAGGRVHSLRTPLDEAIPFVPWTAYLYNWVYTVALYPLFVIRSEAIFRRAAMANALVLTASFLCYAVYPVTSIGLRPDVATLDDRVFIEWAMHLLYVVDPPYNLFPSLHMSMAVIAALSVYRASPLLGACAFPVVAGIAVSICTTKQHFVADGQAALVLATIVYLVVLRRDEGAEAEAGPKDYGWRGALLYLVFHACFYGAVFVAYRLGFKPW